MSKFRTFDKGKAVIVGDRSDADILKANPFGIKSWWFNPLRAEKLELGGADD
ncbi:hypothetical protein [Rhizobium altiplani]|uniref:hypothetical protein n=1 Tax=Rhizobium altiplani TaxID=1864509 RepID=UPI000AC5FD10